MNAPASPWSEFTDTLIEVDTETGREVCRVDLSKLRIRYFAKRLRPATPTQITSQLGALQADPPDLPEFGAATDFSDL